MTCANCKRLTNRITSDYNHLAALLTPLSHAFARKVEPWRSLRSELEHGRLWSRQNPHCGSWGRPCWILHGQVPASCKLECGSGPVRGGECAVWCVAEPLACHTKRRRNTQIATTARQHRHASLVPPCAGLVRTGVAPDHPEVKNVANDFAAVAADDRVSLLGGVRVGQHITVPQLRQHYAGVVLATGAQGSQKRYVGQGVPGVLPARDFVHWYNNHPDVTRLPSPLQARFEAGAVQRVAIIGNGNVAMDCARILLAPLEHLRPTDIAPPALELLQACRVQRVDIIARRGPVQAAFSTKEMRELTRVEGVSCTVASADIDKAANSACGEEAAGARALRRKFELLQSLPEEAAAGTVRADFQFYKEPVDVVQVEGGRLQVSARETEMEGPPGGRLMRYTDREPLSLPAVDMVLMSTGYSCQPLDGAPFARGVVPSEKGRVVGEAGVQRGLYVTGWLRRGPSGTINSNIPDARSVVASVVQDIDAGVLGSGPCAGRAGALQHMADTGVALDDVVTWQGSKAILAAEEAAGLAAGKAAVRFTDRSATLALARSTPGGTWGNAR